jgi:co-chaperonin GroES (HSP10)
LTKNYKRGVGLNEFKIELFGNRILLEKKKLVTTESGIYLPDKEMKVSTVVACGDECKKVSVGDEVIYVENGAVELVVEGEVYFLVNELHLMGKVKKGSRIMVGLV